MADTTAYVVLAMLAIALVTTLILAYVFISRLLVPMTTAVESGIRSLAELLPDQSAIGDALSGKTDAPAHDLLEAIGKAELRQLEPGRAERVGQHHVAAGATVGGAHLTDLVRVGQVP